MKVRMVEERTGPRHDGRPWPKRGEAFYVEDDEGAAICAAGWAIPLPEDDLPVELRSGTSVEARGAEKPAEAPGPPQDARPGINAPKAAWVAWAGAHGMAEDEAAAMSKTDLIAALG